MALTTTGIQAAKTANFTAKPAGAHWIQVNLTRNHVKRELAR